MNTRELTVQELEEKITKVREDAKNIDQEKGREILLFYIEYLEDCLKEARANNKTPKG